MAAAHPDPFEPTVDRRARGLTVAGAPTSPRPRIDGRRLSHETSQVIRRLAVQRVEAGEPPSRVIASFGLCRTTIYRWIRAKRAGGSAALNRRPHPGRAPRVSQDEAVRVRRWILGTSPRDFGLAPVMWTRAAVANLLRGRLGVSMTPMSAGRLLRRIHLDPRAATHVAHVGDLEGGGVVLFAIDRRGAFLCRTIDGLASAHRMQRAMDVLSASAGVPVVFGWSAVV